MLQNLISEIESETAQDETDYNAFSAWFKRQSEVTSASIGSLQMRIQELTAILADLRSRQHTLSGEVARLNGEIEETQTSITEATEKRNGEHDAFVQEQLDFDNSITACNKAVELLTAHFGDGKPKESTKPAWMSLLQSLQRVQRVAVKAQRALPTLTAFLDAAQTPGMRGSQMHDVYEGAGAEAQGIVGQVGSLAATFAEDKQSSIDQENELTAAFNTLMEQKTVQLHSLTTERDAQQAVLTQVNQEIGENANAEATAKGTLQDEQAYLSAIQVQERDTTQMYALRQEDRAKEKEAVSAAMRVLSQEAPSLLQMRRSAVRVHGACPACGDAAAGLKRSALTLHSELLATAAMTTGSGEALGPVVGQLTELVHRLDEQQRAEEAHKAWCEGELAATAKTKAHHEQLVGELQQSIEDSKAVIGEKMQNIKDTQEAVETADADFKEVTAVRTKAKADYETELADYTDSIAALNQAIDILADFYRDEALFVQVRVARRQVPVPGMASREGAPATAGAYVRKGGGHVVSILKETRVDFQEGKASLEAQEKQQVADFEAAKAAYEKSRADLVDAGNRFAAELQTAQLQLTQFETDLADNQEKVAAATTYLAQVGGSCNVLIENFPERTRLRGEEKQAITDAIHILQEAA